MDSRPLSSFFLIFAVMATGALGINVVLYAVLQAADPGAGILAFFLAPFAIPVGAILGMWLGRTIDDIRLGLPSEPVGDETLMA